MRRLLLIESPCAGHFLFANKEVDDVASTVTTLVRHRDVGPDVADRIFAFGDCQGTGIFFEPIEVARFEKTSRNREAHSPNQCRSWTVDVGSETGGPRDFLAEA